MVDEVMEMSDQKKDQIEKNTSKPVTAAPNQKANGEQTGLSKPQVSAWKRLASRKWLFPAAYLAAAAIILGIMIVYQSSQKETLTDENLGLDVDQAEETNEADNDLPVVALPEDFAWPVADMTDIEVVMPYYEESLSNEEKTMAVIQYEDTFVTSEGIALARQDNQTFDVTAALSGKVVRAENAPIIGNVVEIEHTNGLSTIYYSLADVQVSEGQEVQQGDVIAKAGQNEYEKDLGVHLHFEVHQDGEPVNPYTYLPEID
jgi:stage II sporulation protein Q